MVNCSRRWIATTAKGPVLTASLIKQSRRSIGGMRCGLTQIRRYSYPPPRQFFQQPLPTRHVRLACRRHSRMNNHPSPPFVDIHCHLIPGIDDGAQTWQDTLSMARIAVQSGTQTIVVTPHQLGNFRQNSGDFVRDCTTKLQHFLQQHQVPLTVLPGGDVRIEEGMIDGIKSGSVVTLGDHRKQVLLELPHELYFPLEPLLDDLNAQGIQGILSHPERNVGLLAKPQLLAPLVDRGCLMQVTCGSLVGTFGPASQSLAEFMLKQGLIHFLASDGHSPRRRRPHMSRGFQRTLEVAGRAAAIELCCTNPLHVANGEYVDPGRRRFDPGELAKRTSRSAGESKEQRGWFSTRRAA